MYLYEATANWFKHLWIDEIFRVPIIFKKLCQNNTLSMDLDLSWSIPGDSVEKISNFLRITRYSKALKLITFYEENLDGLLIIGRGIPKIFVDSLCDNLKHLWFDEIFRVPITFAKITL
ncbi:hypothetical protein F8M41_026037 [Gigaspora margarita]|uniref:Uncharacterized protein n=1 Tax=Gigaspora margarita TaxID=4874 RepID=A0A8H3XK15_GIGMA|nr:hypothetical protein F8M41_026037 [Gigaspora margarita]